MIFHICAARQYICFICDLSLAQLLNKYDFSFIRIEKEHKSRIFVFCSLHLALTV
uniref:Uncharacterized protein n=1 Tax=Anguilla anguilla TaxID=7936 RepID=A0A0E9PF10_ANGAN